MEQWWNVSKEQWWNVSKGQRWNVSKEQWCNVSIEQWWNVSMEQWWNVSMEQLRNVSMEQWWNVSMEQWWNVSMEQWWNVSMEQWWNDADGRSRSAINHMNQPSRHSNVSGLLLVVTIAQYVSGIRMPIIRSSITAVAASGVPLERGGSSVVGRGRADWPYHD